MGLIKAGMGALGGTLAEQWMAVSYTHLDVYKRQVQFRWLGSVMYLRLEILLHHRRW